MRLEASVVRDDVQAIEDAFVAHWANFGRGPGGNYHDDGDLIWIEAPVPQLPYNAVIRSRLIDDFDDRIAKVTAHFRERRVNFLWLVHPSAQPPDLGARLAAHGLALVETATGMSMDLTLWAKNRTTRAPEVDGQIAYREVQSNADMDSFEVLMAYYWELPPDSRRYAYGINRWVGTGPHAPGVRWIAFIGAEPVGKAYLSLLGSPDTAAIFGVSVRREARGHGVASILTEHLLERAVELGRRRVVLHSSENAVNLYRRMGFVERCALPVYATAVLHTLQTS
jgi:ribosomal protein S18 acetylase RimI-like enzyme